MCERERRKRVCESRVERERRVRERRDKHTMDTGGCDDSLMTC